MSRNQLAIWIGLAFAAGALCSRCETPAHAVESYSSQLARIASAAERIASTLEKAAR